MKLFGADDLVILMALARDQDHVSGTGRLDRRGDGRAAVRLYDEVPAPKAGKDLVDDRARLLRAGIVARDHRPIGAQGHLTPHERAFASVPVPAAAEDGDEAGLLARASGQKGAKGAENVLQGVGRVGVIDEDVKAP